MKSNIGPKWTTNRNAVLHVCAVCKAAYEISREDPYPSRTCNNPCIDAIEIVRDAKRELAFNFESTGDGSAYNWALRILKRMKEAA